MKFSDHEPEGGQLTPKVGCPGWWRPDQISLISNDRLQGRPFCSVSYIGAGELCFKLGNGILVNKS